MELTAILKTPPFVGMKEADVTEMLFGEPHQLRVLAAGDVLFRQGDACHSLIFLAAGELRAEMTGDDGRRLTVELLRAPSLVASAFLFAADNRYPVTATLCTPAEVFFIERSRVLQWMTAHPTLIQSFVGDVSNRIVFLTRKLRTFALQSLKDRLLDYVAAHGRLGPLEEVARQLGVQRPSLSRALAELVAEGKIKR